MVELRLEACFLSHLQAPISHLKNIFTYLKLLLMKGKGLFMQELAEKTIKELVQMRKQLKKELYTLKMKNAIKGLKETHKL
jgi:ribosomal protein L29